MQGFLNFIWLDIPPLLQIDSDSLLPTNQIWTQKSDISSLFVVSGLVSCLSVWSLCQESSKRCGVRSSMFRQQSEPVAQWSMGCYDITKPPPPTNQASPWYVFFKGGTSVTVPVCLILLLCRRWRLSLTGRMCPSSWAVSLWAMTTGSSPSNQKPMHNR